ncbi:hypothetical protein ACU4GD_29165 [Cupriavidus basilensis]
MSVHEWAGALVIVLAVPRLLWRLLGGAPAPGARPALDASAGRRHAPCAASVYLHAARAGPAGPQRGWPA